MSADAFFEVLSDDDDVLSVRATGHARGPWDPEALHAGPPSGLLAAALSRHHPSEGRIPTRMSVEILRPVPLGELRVRTKVRRPGRQVELVHALMTDAGGNEVMTGALWRIREADAPMGVGVEGVSITDMGLPAPQDAAPSRTRFREAAWDGCVQAMDIHFARGDWSDPGPAVAWLRQRVPLLDDGPTTPLERALVAADFGNGVSSRAGGPHLGPTALFVNVDLGVHLTRLPVGEWIGMDAATTLTDHGVALAATVLHDTLGPIGRGAQSLLVNNS